MECLLVYSIEGIAFVLERQSFLRMLWNWPCPYGISDVHNVVYVTCSAIFFFGRLHSGGIAQYYLYSGSLLDKWGTIRSPFSMWTSSQSLLSFGYTSHRADTVTVVVNIVDTHVEMFTQFFSGSAKIKKKLAQIALRPYPWCCCFDYVIEYLLSRWCDWHSRMRDITGFNFHYFLVGFFE